MWNNNKSFDIFSDSKKNEKKLKEDITAKLAQCKPCRVQLHRLKFFKILKPATNGRISYKSLKESRPLTPFFRTGQLLYHKIENIVIFRPGNHTP